MNPITEIELRLALDAADTDARPGVWTRPLNDAMQACAITTPERQAAFLARILRQSGGLRQLQDNLSYSVRRLRERWPHRFPSDDAAAPFSHHPMKLANFIYADQMGNGNEASGDGWRYRGRGLIRVAGRDSYARFAKATRIDVLANPDLLQLPPAAAMAAAWFWNAEDHDNVADQLGGADADNHRVALTRRFNGALIGRQTREAY